MVPGKFEPNLGERWLALIMVVRPGMTEARQNLGKSGENLAAAELESRGYAIVERRYRTAHGEIDIIARDGETMVFVEVRRKSTGEFGTAAESVTPSKQRRVIRMAIAYLAMHGLYDRCPVRFDVVGIDDLPDGTPQVTVYAGAFDDTRR
jgi:putative endonuclease